MSKFIVRLIVDSPNNYSKPLEINHEYPVDLPSMDEYLTEFTLLRMIEEMIDNSKKLLVDQIVSKDTDKFPELRTDITSDK